MNDIKALMMSEYIYSFGDKKGGEYMNNIGTVDRIIRFVIGLAIVAVALYYKSWWGLVGLEIGFTGLLGWSPIYKLFDISTGGIRGSHGSVV